jgi:hypothetical protein
MAELERLEEGLVNVVGVEGACQRMERAKQLAMERVSTYR